MMTILPGNVTYIGTFPELKQSTEEPRARHRQEFERNLLGSECLALGSFPIFADRYAWMRAKYSQSQMSSLGGNMFAGTIIGALAVSLVYTLPWSSPVTVGRADVDAADTEEALELFKAFRS